MSDYLLRLISRFKLSVVLLIYMQAISPIFSSSVSASSVTPSPDKKTVVIMTIDGGGTRGIIPAVLLDALQRKVGQHLAGLVDMWGGTSIGGIEALMLNKPDEDDPSKPQYSPKDLIDLMPREGGRIFPKSFYNRVSSGWGLWAPLYPSSGIESVAQEYFGDTYLSQSVSNVIVAGFDISRNVPIFFKSTSAKAREECDYKMCDVARFTSSAQTYFPVASIQSKTGRVVSGIDGGNVCNNITMSAIVEARKKFPEATDWLVVNFGTGRVVKTVDYNSVRDKGTLHWVRPTISITMDGVSSVVDYQLNELLPPIEMGDGYYKRRYYRFQPTIPESIASLDSIENLSALRMIAETYVQEHDAELEAIAEEIITINGGKKRGSRILSSMLSEPISPEHHERTIDHLSDAISTLKLESHTPLSDSDDSSQHSESSYSSYTSSDDDLTLDNEIRHPEEKKESQFSLMYASLRSGERLESERLSDVALPHDSITSQRPAPVSPRKLLPSLSSPRFDLTQLKASKKAPDLNDESIDSSY